MNDRLAKYARPKLDDARLARQWSVISKTPVARRSNAWIVLAFAAAMAVVALVTWRVERARHVPVASRAGVTDLESTASPSTLVLADGSRITAGPHSHVSFEETSATSTRVALLAGAADFDVKHDPSRAFIVTARGVTIVDTGTRFHVEYTEANRDVRVTVFEGSVRVERAERAPSSLSAGDSWASGNSAIAPLDSTSTVTPAEGVVVDAGRASTITTPDDSFARFAAMAERDPNGAFEVFGEARYPRAIARATPKQLFELGDAARLSGHPVQAADAFDALRSKHRDDPRAGLAALQLARLREDTLHDPAGAENALRDAIALAPDPTLREDAEARRVGVLQAMNDHTGCIQARDAYLAKYPSGVHRVIVEKRCTTK